MSPDPPSDSDNRGEAPQELQGGQAFDTNKTVREKAKDPGRPKGYVDPRAASREKTSAEIEASGGLAAAAAAARKKNQMKALASPSPPPTDKP